MPIPQTVRVNQLDLQGNIAIGVSLPFNAPGVFKKTYSTKDQIKSNLQQLQQQEKVIAQELEKKYGDGTISLESGEFLPK